MHVRLLAAAASAALALCACKKKEEPKPASGAAPSTAPAPTPTPAPAEPKWPGYSPEELNRLALLHDTPLYWRGDANKNGRPDADEVTSLLFYPRREVYVQNGRLTPIFWAAVESLAAAKAEPKGAPAEVQRRKLVREDLEQGTPTLVYNDLRGLSPEEKTFVQRMLEAALQVDELHAKLTGVVGLRSSVPPDDLSSQSLLRRNWGPRCVGPRTFKNPACSAIPGGPSAIFDLYPAALQKDSKFCQALEKDEDHDKLLAPFFVVRDEKGKLVPVAYSTAYATEMGAIAAKIDDAAAALPKTEEPLRAYLVAAAKAFRNNDWASADEQWALMSATNSKWYVRIAADETYWEPCKRKAGFHVSFARINADSLAWQKKLIPVQQEMEDRLAKAIGEPYAARKVTFKLPDFIDVVWNAGDDRGAFGATIGQSLPNWGKVAAESRGRTVAMSNLFQDPLSLSNRRKGAESLLTKEAMAHYADAKITGLLATILHEATHNLGPAHEYEFGGKTAPAAFGGELAAMLEELKAQTGALFFLDLLRQRGIISDKEVRESLVDAVVWCFGHISRGMYDAEGRRRAYSQLAAIHVGFLLDEGVLKWDANAMAANGTDKGAFSFAHEKLVPSAAKLMTSVGAIKAKNDKAGAMKLVLRHVDGKTVPQKLITERLQRLPRTSFVYGFDL